MKKHLIIFSLILSVLTVFGQEVKPEKNTEPVQADTTAVSSFCHHRLNLYLGGSMTNNIYNRLSKKEILSEGVDQIYSLGSVFEIKYAYFFNEHWGISAGVGLGYYTAKAKLNFSGVIEDYPDELFKPESPEISYDLHYRSNNVYERQRSLAIEIPLQANWEHRFNNKHGLYAGLGVKAVVPIGKMRVDYLKKNDQDGTITTWGTEEYGDLLYQDMPNHFGTTDFSSYSTKTKMRFTVDAQADFGGIFQIAPRADFYLGVYGSIAFMDKLPKEKLDYFTPEVTAQGQTGKMVLNPLVASNILEKYDVRTKWNMWQVGLKIGFHIHCCPAGNDPNKKSMKDLKRKMMEDIGRIADNTKPLKDIADNTGRTADNTGRIADALEDTLRVYAFTPKDLDDRRDIPKNEKDAIRELGELMGRVRIMFDLDKDIPKYDAQSADYMERAAQILKKYPKVSMNIEGYTCKLGSEEHNQDLAKRRSMAVKNIFIGKGVNASQLTTEGYTYNSEINRRNIPSSILEEHRTVLLRIDRAVY
jgi:outer membrane protein OmpA-like peptidoglycan-associated protein